MLFILYVDIKWLPLFEIVILWSQKRGSCLYEVLFRNIYGLYDLKIGTISLRVKIPPLQSPVMILKSTS